MRFITARRTSVCLNVNTGCLSLRKSSTHIASEVARMGNCSKLNELLFQDSAPMFIFAYHMGILTQALLCRPSTHDKSGWPLPNRLESQNRAATLALLK